MGMTCCICKKADGSGPLATLPWVGEGSEGNWQSVFHNGPAPRNCYAIAVAAGLV